MPPTTTSTTDAPRAPRTGDHRVGFRTLDRETRVEALPVEGDVPAWLTGSLVRTGPAQFEVGGRGARHWFDGLAMLHRFGFADGSVSYANRYLDTEARRRASSGERPLAEFASDPCRSIFARVQSLFSPGFTDNANVNLVRLGERCMALTETPLPIVFDEETLATIGAERSPGDHTTAHPHHVDGELLTYAVHFGARSTYRIHASADGRSYREVARVPVREPGYMHSFAVTQRYAVLAEHPLLVNPLRLALSAESFIESYRWHADRPTRLIVIDRHTGVLRGTYEAEPCFVFHHINAYEDGAELVLDVCAYDDDEIIRSLFLDRLRTAEPRLPRVEPRRWCVDLDGGSVSSERLADVSLELPRVNYRAVNGRRHRYAWGAGAGDVGFIDRIVKVDVESGDVATWHEPGRYPGEPVFVQDPSGAGEDAGVLLSVVLDAARETSFLLVLDAATLEERARAEVPHAIPFGFHGQYLGARS